MPKFQNWLFLFLIVFPILFKVQRCTIPHLKVLYQLFWSLAWVLTVGAITFLLLRKISVYFFLDTLYLWYIARLYFFQAEFLELFIPQFCQRTCLKDKPEANCTTQSTITTMEMTSTSRSSILSFRKFSQKKKNPPNQSHKMV